MFLRSIMFAFRQGMVRGYRKAERHYKAELHIETMLKSREIVELRRKNEIEIERMRREYEELYREKVKDIESHYMKEKARLEEEIKRLRKAVKRAQEAYEMFADDLFEFGAIVQGQASEANMVSLKGAELLQAVRTLHDRTETIARRIERKEERIKKLLEYRDVV